LTAVRLGFSFGSVESLRSPKRTIPAKLGSSRQIKDIMNEINGKPEGGESRPAGFG
jgi:hypothetical protein